MERTFEGLCVGGPKDGLLFECRFDTFKAVTLEDVAVIYRHMTLWDQGFWLPEDESVHYLVERLANNYRLEVK